MNKQHETKNLECDAIQKSSQKQTRYAGIVALGSYVPDKILTNHDLENMVETSDEWITTRTGIHQRRVAEADDFTSDLAIKAVEAMQARHGEAVLDGVDMVLVATNTPDALFPAVSALVQDHFKLQAGAFDLLTGCAGWLYALSVARAYVESGVHEKVLVIGAEVLSKITDWEDRTTAVLFGDGAGAAIVSSVASAYGFRATMSGADGSKADHLRSGAVASTLPSGESLTPYIQMNGREVFKFAVRLLENTIPKIVAEAGLTLDDIAYIAPHQANLRILDAAREHLEISEDRFLVTLDSYANNSTASIPLALDHAFADGRLQSGDNILMISFGAGFTWSATILTWGDLG